MFQNLVFDLKMLWLASLTQKAFLRLGLDKCDLCGLGQVWYLIVSIPDLCTLTYFDFSFGAYSMLVLFVSS